MWVDVKSVKSGVKFNGLCLQSRLAELTAINLPSNPSSRTLSVADSEEYATALDKYKYM